MLDEEELPRSLIERASMLEGILIDTATGGSSQNAIYEYLRREFMQAAEYRDLLPSFVRTYRNLSAFWGWIKHEAPTYAERRTTIAAGFGTLMDHLEGKGHSPSDASTTDSLQSLNDEDIAALWHKALSRRQTDPEGAITLARTLLEAVCKKILDDSTVPYSDKDDLPKLYGLAARTLKLAPDQHSEEAIKAILGGAMALVNGIGTLRNRLSDSHGRGAGRLPVKPLPRHASLAVNVGGSLASFLAETYREQNVQS